jgi:hypothetical protein
MSIKLRVNEADAIHEAALAWGYKDQFISPNSQWERYRIATSEQATQGLSIIFYNNAKGNKVTLTGDGHEKLYDDFRELYA